MIGYIGIGFLTLGKAVIPMLPESFELLGINFQITLMGAVIVIAIITGIYITFGGQTAVIFTDLLQGFILLFAGLFLFALGVSYLGGIDVFWNLLPTEWKMPLAKFNDPSSFNFVGIFWQDGVAGSIGFLFLNMGLIMRFMATKSVNEGRKAAAFNILFMLPISAIVVGNAGWVGKAISIAQPDVVPPNTSPDQIFVVVANIVSSPGVFGFIMAALTAALMSTVDTLINATAAIYINDVHRPIKKWLKKYDEDAKSEDRHELVSARFASVAITTLGVLAVLAFKNFPTVYEAHGFFHSTLTPPLVVAVFLGIFWRKFTPAAVISTFLGGVTLMILGANYPAILIAPFDHGVEMNLDHPYSYIRALYNLLVNMIIAVIATVTTAQQIKIVDAIKKKENHRAIMFAVSIVAAIIFVVLVFSSSLLTLHTESYLEITAMILLAMFMAALVALSVNYFVEYDETAQTTGLTAWSISKAREMFKGRKVNDREGETIKINWKITPGDEETINFSKNDMQKMQAEAGDLVYICDARKRLGGLKSVHAVYGEAHDEDGIVYITEEYQKQGQFVEGRILTAEKEM
jgi:SSS family solute:Na+ symporter